jgi:hypothetical protein
VYRTVFFLSPNVVQNPAILTVYCKYRIFNLTILPWIAYVTRLNKVHDSIITVVQGNNQIKYQKSPKELSPQSLLGTSSDLLILRNSCSLVVILLFFRAFVICALTVLTSSQAILIYWSKQSTGPKDPTQDEKHAKYKYSVTTSNFLVSKYSIYSCNFQFGFVPAFQFKITNK